MSLVLNTRKKGEKSENLEKEGFTLSKEQIDTLTSKYKQELTTANKKYNNLKEELENTIFYNDNTGNYRLTQKYFDIYGTKEGSRVKNNFIAKNHELKTFKEICDEKVDSLNTEISERDQDISKLVTTQEINTNLLDTMTTKVNNYRAGIWASTMLNGALTMFAIYQGIRNKRTQNKYFNSK